MSAVIDPIETTQHVILSGISWDTYERLLAEQQEKTSRLSYDQGRLEIMILSLRHEKLKHLLATLVELLAAELDIDVEGAGSTTFRRRDLGRGFEPDACFYFRHAQTIRTLTSIDLNTDPAPELVIEIDISRHSLDKLPIFASLGIAEIWRYQDTQIRILRASQGHFQPVSDSALLPGVTASLLSELIDHGQKESRAVWRQRIQATIKPKNP